MDKKEELMQTIKKMMQYLGFGDAESTIYALLALSNEPLTIMEIAGKINYSIARIYSSISYLMKEGLVEKNRENGTTKYTANINFIDVFERRRQEIMEKFLLPIISMQDHDERVRRIVEYSKQVYNYFEKLNELKKKTLV
ncbi:MAG: helix-turn-helix domain-containing protein [Thermoplasmata archaeon]|jgi:DNA-binding transcriptional regulator GbsR (MarR family)|nr:TrmB family transcriptional regulator [Thermoplasmatales archaeon]